MALDPNLADQVLPFLTLIAPHSPFTTSQNTHHLKTNIGTVITPLPKCRIEPIEQENRGGDPKGNWRHPLWGLNKGEN